MISVYNDIKLMIYFLQSQMGHMCLDPSHEAKLRLEYVISKTNFIKLCENVLRCDKNYLIVMEAYVVTTPTLPYPTAAPHPLHTMLAS